MHLQPEMLTMSKYSRFQSAFKGFYKRTSRSGATASHTLADLC